MQLKDESTTIIGEIGGQGGRREEKTISQREFHNMCDLYVPPATTKDQFEENNMI